MASLDLEIAGLSPKQRALLELRLRHRRRAVVEDGVRRRPPEMGDVALSFAQERLWLLDRLVPGNPAYNVHHAWRVEGRLRPPVLARALTEVVRRHEVLRTSYPEVEGRPVQRIAAPRPVALPEVDLSASPPRAALAEVERLAAAASARPFDLACGPPLRALLLRIGRLQHVLLLTIHHIASDAWSLPILQRELLTLYGSFAAHEPSPLPELAVQYADFALWEGRRLQGERLAATLAYWRRQLAGMPAVLELPTDRPRGALLGVGGGVRRVALDAGPVRALGALAAAGEATLYMALLTVLRAVLGCWSGQDDVAIGMPMAERSRPEVEPLIGFFVNTLVIRTRFGGELGFGEALARVREAILDAHAHRGLPFEKLVSELRPERSLAHSPLFQVMFVLHNVPREELAAADLRIHQLPVPDAASKFDLSLALEDDGSGRLGGVLEYRRDLFDGATVERLASHLGRLLAQVVEDPARPLRELAPWTAAERHQVLAEWNDTRVAVDPEALLHRLVELQAAASPGAVAVVAEEGSLTYRELAERASRLARRLRQAGAGPDRVVGVCLERSPAMIVALLAVLESGAAYLPLDPDLPRERLDDMIADAGLRVVLTAGAVRESLAGVRAEVLELDPGSGALAGDGAGAERADRGLAAQPAPDGLAYVIYTSGSTGKPKGAMNTHRAICNRLLWMQARYRLTPEDRVLQKTPYSFDVSVWELFWPLIAGARLVFARPQGHRDGAYLAALIDREGITTAHFVPSMLQSFLGELPAGACGCLRRVLASGEALSASLRDLCLSRLGAELHNLYGPTEAAVDVTSEVCGGRGTAAAPPLGRPIWNLRLYVLDDAHRPLPIGVPGELHIGGRGLARGYLARPGLTGERFMPDPCGDEPGARLYRTGDRARTLADGRLEYLGRLDRQLKVRGFRIEPGEVESALRRHPDVREAAVEGDARQGSVRLVAYLVAAAPPPTVAALRAFLRGTLPEYMLPAVFVFLESFPRTPSGKLDRRSLPPPDGLRPLLEGVAAAPRSLAEELLLEIWHEVLGVTDAGIRDSFFDLGGDSLTATRALSRVRDTFKVELPLRSLFEAQTVEQLAALVERTDRAAAPLPPLLPVERGGEIPLSFAQQRIWLLDRLQPGNLAYNLGAAFRLRGALAVPALAYGLHELVRRHESLRTTFALAGGSPVQVIAPPAPLPLPVVDLAALSPGAPGAAERLVRKTLTDHLRRPFDLASGPLLRPLLLRLEARHHLLFLATHHTVVDGWSLVVMREELTALYGALLAGRPSPLPELTVQYADFAAWQRGWLRGALLEGEVGYWRERLAGAPPFLELPTDRPRPPLQRSRGATVPWALPVQLGEGVRRLVRQAGATPFILLLAALATLLQRISGQHDLSIGMPTAGRNRRELEGLVGCLVNMLVLRLSLAGDPPFEALLQQARETALAAHAHQDLPFEKLVEELHPARDLGHSPLFQVMFIFQNLHVREVRMEGLDLTPVKIEEGGSKFDLSLVANETPAGLVGVLEFDADLFDRATVVRLLQRWETLLQGIVEAPACRLSALPSMPAAERQAVLLEHNDTAAPACRDSICRRFAAQAARTPEAVAVETREESLTYRELARRAGRLARRLRRLGVGPEVRVGCCVERSTGMVVALLAILEAGGCYVPLDPAYPRVRLAAMLEDARPLLVVTESHLLDRLPPGGAPPLCLDGEAPAAAAPDGAPADGTGPPWPEPQAGQLAYVIYTSGSTGKPKGVAVTHGALANFLVAMAERPGLAPADRLLAVTSLSFDIAGLEIYLPLATGARVVLADRDTAADGSLLLALLRTSGAGVLQATGATWRLLLDAGWQGGDGLRALCGGEALPRNLADRLRRRAGEVWNLYGPTETTIWSARFAVGDGAEAVVPIGRPISNTAIYLLDEHLLPVALGVAGELYIGGDGLARGYLGAPALTAERFVPDGYGGRPGARLYRTGDLARRRHGGELEFLGRADQQVKLRGFRIELGEVEAVCAEHPAVAVAAAAIASDPAGDRRLVVYLVPAAGEAPDLEELRAFLRERLPEHLLPSGVASLDAMPLTPNGKLDRRALPAFQWRRAGAPGPSGPGMHIEERLASIWARALALPAVGLHDNFFSLGGHSLLAAKLVLDVQEAFGVEILLRMLFEAPTVAEMAALVARQELAQAAAAPPRPAPLVPAPGERHQPFPLTEVQQAYWLGRSGAFDLGNVASHAYTEIDLAGLDVARFQQALQRLIERHDMLRAVVLPDGRQQVLEHVPPYRIAVQDLSGLAPEAAAPRLSEVRRRMSHQVMPAERWPLFEVCASRLSPARVRLHVSLDFLIADAYSTDVLRRDLAAFYRDPGATLPPIELSFRDCVLGELAWRESETYRRAWRYWSERLDTLPPAPELPRTSGAAPAQPRFTRAEGRLEPERWRRLRGRAAQAGVTAAGALLAAFSEVLRAWSKSPRFTLNLTLFNRLPLHPDVDRVVGDFTSLTLLAVEDPGPSSFEARTRRLQAQLWHDLDARLVNGVQVLRELNRRGGAGGRVMMPVVFTSTLELAAAAAPDETAATGEGEGGFVYGITQTPQVWLDHQAGEVGGALAFNWDVLDGVFPEGMVAAMFAAYGELLGRLADEPAAWLEPRPLALARAELAAREQANDTAVPLPPVTLHELFESQASRAPERAAVITAAVTLSYGRLERLANALAHRLAALGARPNQLVAVVMEKGWEQVAAVLAVLKAGAAYLPLDPATPRERLWWLLEHGEAAIVLTQPWVDESVAWPEGVTRLRVEAGTADEAAAAAAGPPALPRDPGALAYVIFTSGSTGTPKGVMIDHRGAANTVLDVNRRFGVGPDDRVLALSALSFDLSVYDVFGPLAAGGAIVIPEAAALRDPARWAELIERERVTIWDSVPALLGMLVEHCAAPAGPPLARLRLALLSGDWIPVGLPDRLRQLADGVRVVSLGGATEASIWSICYVVERVDPAWSSIPYGKPLANQRLHVLDAAMEPRPVWVPGDLYIGGVGGARGYWRDEEKTRASFGEHPLTGERLYRTGDLGRYLPDGNIEFLGREDAQVKIQGYRIELGEIEAALEQLPEVRAAVVAAVGQDRFNRRLVAYVVPRPEGMAQEPTEPGAAAGAAGEPRAAAGDVVELPGPEPDARRLRRFDGRRTQREFAAAPLPGERLAALLSCLAQIRLEGFPLPKYRYPSAGSLYPVQAYLQVQPGRVDGVEAGLYYYHPKRHCLVRLAAATPLSPPAYAEVNRQVFAGAAFALLLVARLAAIEPVYGGQALDFSLIEAGAMGELLMETAAATEVGLCPIGGLDFAAVRGALALDDSHELVYSFLGGPPLAPAAAAAPAPADLPPATPPAAGRTAASGRSATQAPRRPLGEAAALELKLSEPGVRRDDAGRPVVAWPLPATTPDWLEPFAERRSHREFLAAPASLAQVGALLGALAQVRGARTSYRYPSAGGLYPVRAYLQVRPGRVAGLAAGIYEHDPHRHMLALVAPGAAGDRGMHAAVNQAIFDQSAFAIFLVAGTAVASSRYGASARDFCLLEAGAMGQLLRTVAPDCGLGLCPIGTVDLGRLGAAFRLGPDQVLLHSLLGGPVALRASLGDRTALLERLRGRLRQRLPEYMVPATWVALEALPLSANGKVDRRALPDPDRGEAPAPRPYKAPDSELERVVAGIWGEVLQLARVGLEDNFFDLGGNSLHMVRVHALLQESLGREIRVTELFKHSTVGALARELGAETRAAPAFAELQEQAERRWQALARQRQRRQEEEGRHE